MPSSPDQAHHKLRSETLGVVLMAAAMLIVPIADAIAKYLSGVHAPVFLTWARYVAALGFILPVAMVQRGQRPSPTPAWSSRHWLSQILRAGFLVAAMALYFAAIARIPLADALGAYFIAPIAATLLAAILLRERLDRRKLIAVLLGFVGAILVVRPGAQTSADTLIALASGGCMAGYLVLTRLTAQDRPPVATLTIQLVLGVAMLTPFALLQWTTPTRNGLLLILLMGLVSTLGHLMTISAFRLAPVATLSPLVYLELIGATALGFALFGDLPSPMTWAGIAVIVAAGLIVATAPPAKRRMAP
ncbi:Threonine/homoserine efflux transporter RhtA [Bosea sp. 62]|uniref:DMT family transporter n=1 Tax=unclassified Bosea (in: a-proteobacteria) TaxID=2653178 RepID=UPI0012599E40|nr:MULTISPECIES: EamA family transporter [unclassified Bosea (in: a-proteobacteria)]CAD5259964.1 Threonine/homoserine efflux transporter RhtA [Bosea sp. 46]CAD5264441.1 Threonine/homoserine efflux transporter RhtA [Bosea sp. 21B]CAD5275882.1 Threonine/homoserine efflux transporter RhtA [Bosea sp. 7B]VVT59107.1 Threonine/homoserine efflux transporter RhtA [Bosea sp. EC-HK365B]VXB69510.1 Threonine/homoserine efflux transporter RhtA [Bosea sp. 29B]